VDRVRSSNEWGGHLELRALSEGLNKCIVVYSANQPVLVLGEEGDAIRLSYHLHYYSLGEHYNQVVPRTTTLDED
jgi:OTU domain-containing protein 6